MDGDIFGSIDHPEGAPLANVIVTFTDDPQLFNDHATVARVTNAIERATNLDRMLSNTNSIVGSGKDFVVKVSLSHHHVLERVSVILIRRRAGVQ